jgi:membrane protein implicated in regulation of membrane protease activity
MIYKVLISLVVILFLIYVLVANFIYFWKYQNKIETNLKKLNDESKTIKGKRQKFID